MSQISFFISHYVLSEKKKKLRNYPYVYNLLNASCIDLCAIYDFIIFLLYFWINWNDILLTENLQLCIIFDQFGRYIYTDYNQLQSTIYMLSR